MRLGDLLGRLDAGDPAAQLLEAGHRLAGSFPILAERLAEGVQDGASARPPVRRSASSACGSRRAGPGGRRAARPGVRSGSGRHRRRRQCPDSRACRRRARRPAPRLDCGAYCGCFSSSVRRSPRASWRWVDDIEIGAELGERRHLPVLGELALQRSRSPCCIALIWALPPTREHRDADVHRRPDALVEQVGLQEDLAVGDRDHVGRDVGRDVVGLGLDDRQGRQRPAAELVVQLGRALQEPRVQVEDIARIGFAAGRAAKQQATSGDRRRPAWRGRRR